MGVLKRKWQRFLSMFGERLQFDAKVGPTLEIMRQFTSYVYVSREGGVPCVVASVCEPHWHGPHELKAASGTRGDAKDAQRGGYNVDYDFGPIVCDLRLSSSATTTAGSREDAMVLG